MAGEPWSVDEVDVVVDSYFRMLRAEMIEDPLVKRRENEWVRHRVRGRSSGSVEFKYQNISAVLLGLGAGEFVRGYKPRKNVQQALIGAVAQRLRDDPEIERLMLAAAERPLGIAVDFNWNLTPPPDCTLAPEELSPCLGTPIRTDFLKLEAEHRVLGLEGELAIVGYEQRVLGSAGLGRLADQVEHVSQTKGDGLGYDIRSFSLDGREKFIEVKTTRRPRGFPFLVTRNEVRFSAAESAQFHLYRVFDFGQPRTGLYTVPGALVQSFDLSPTTFIARARSLAVEPRGDVEREVAIDAPAR